MRTKLSENEVNRIPIDAVTHALSKMPYDGQSEEDKTYAEHFLLRALSSHISARVKKLDDALKDAAKNSDAGIVQLSKNFRREVTFGTPRSQFDLESFIDKIVAAYPDIPKHKLREFAGDSKKLTAAPNLITIEYIGDV